MPKFAKPRVNTIARDLGQTNKAVIEVLAKHGVTGKSPMSTLANKELDIILDYYMQKADDGTPMPQFYKEDATGAHIVSEHDTPRSVSKRKKYVDVRPSTVDLAKLDTEHVEKLAPIEMKDNMTSTQKIKKGRPQRTRTVHETPKVAHTPHKKEKITVNIPDTITVMDLATALKLPSTEVIKKLMSLGIMASISQSVDYEAAALVAEDCGAIVHREIIVTDEERLFNDFEDTPDKLTHRAPVVVVMGHVDHGKTSLLDAIRETNVIATESGGITQHIGAYRVTVNNKKITFLDTPGHEAFTAMRARGAQITDVAIIVVAADDGIMPQTVEAINHAKAAGVSIIVAINKIDKDGANVERVMQELTEHELVPEEWGGDIICVPISAKKRTNLSQLLEMVILVSEMKELKANKDRLAKGTVIEARLDKGRGALATVLVQNGTLRVGDFIVAGSSVGKIRAMVSDRGHAIKKAGPSVPVEIVGLSDTPEGGDLFYAVKDERLAKNIALKRKQQAREEQIRSDNVVTLDNLFSHLKEGNIKDLNIIVKADVQGSVEAITQSLEKISTNEVRVRVIHGGVGAINESDVMLATASSAIIVGFHVRPALGAAESAALNSVDIRLYRVIYEAISEIKQAMTGMLAPVYKEVTAGRAEVRQVFKITGAGTIAGCYVLDGKIIRNQSVRVVRDGVVMFEGNLDSLKRFKDDAKEVASGYECGMGLERFNDIKQGDIIECFIMEEIERKV